MKQQYALLRAWNDTFGDKRFVDSEMITILCRSSFKITTLRTEPFEDFQIRYQKTPSWIKLLILMATTCLLKDSSESDANGHLFPALRMRMEFDGITPCWHSFHNGKGLNEIPVLFKEWRSRLKLPQATKLEAHISARAQKLIMVMSRRRDEGLICSGSMVFTLYYFKTCTSYGLST